MDFQARGEISISDSRAVKEGRNLTITSVISHIRLRAEWRSNRSLQIFQCIVLPIIYCTVVPIQCSLYIAHDTPGELKIPISARLPAGIGSFFPWTILACLNYSSLPIGWIFELPSPDESEGDQDVANDAEEANQDEECQLQAGLPRADCGRRKIVKKWSCTKYCRFGLWHGGNRHFFFIVEEFMQYKLRTAPNDQRGSKKVN